MTAGGEVAIVVSSYAPPCASEYALPVAATRAVELLRPMASS